MTGGSGDLAANLFRLHLGGRTYLPAAAEAYAHAATALHALTPAVEELASGIDHEVAEAFTDILGAVHLGAARTAINLDRAGAALVEVAERFARTDGAAHEEFERLCRTNREDLAPGAPFSRPPMPGDAHPVIPHGQARGA